MPTVLDLDPNLMGHALIRHHPVFLNEFGNQFRCSDPVQYLINKIYFFTYEKVNTLGIWNATIQNPEMFEIQSFLRSDFKWSGFQRVWLKAKAMVPTIWKTDFLSGFNHMKNWLCVWIFNGFSKNGGHLSGFQMVGISDFRSQWQLGGTKGY